MMIYQWQYLNHYLFNKIVLEKSNHIDLDKIKQWKINYSLSLETFYLISIKEKKSIEKKWEINNKYKMTSREKNE